MPNGNATNPETFGSPWENIEEFFPGYKESIKSVTATQHQATEELQSASSDLQNYRRFLSVQSSIESMPVVGTALTASNLTKDLFESVFAFLSPLFVTKLVLPRDYQAMKDRANTALTNYNQSTWKQTVLTGLPYLLADIQSSVSTVDDVIAKFPNASMSAEDRAWLEDIFGKLTYLMPTGNVPQTAEDIRDIVQQVTTPVPVSTHQLATQEVIKAFKTSIIPALPSGLTEAQLLEAIGNLSFSEEETAAITDIHNLTTELQQAWADQSAYTELIKAGLAEADVDELTALEMMKMAITQPVLATFEIFDKYYKWVVRPLAAAAIINVGGQLDEDSRRLTDIYQQHRELGDNAWEAYSEAYEEWDVSAVTKFFLDMIFDPTTYIGFGIATKATKFIPYVGRFVGAVERGWLELWDAPFAAIRQGIKLIPKTPGQAAVSEARRAFMTVRAYLQRIYPEKSIIGMTGDQFREGMEYAIKLNRANPIETGNLGVAAGDWALTHDFLDEAKIGQWLKDLGSKETLTPQLMQDTEFLFDLFWRKALTPDEVAVKLLDKFGIAVSDDATKSMVKVISREAANIEANAMKLFSGDSAQSILKNFLVTIEDIHAKKFNSSMYKMALQGGRVTGWTRKLDKVLRWSTINWIDRKITVPMANQYLLFANYGPFNVVESMMRSFLGGGELFYPRSASPIDEFVRLGQGLTNMPYEFVQLSDELARLEIAIVNPRTGETVAYKKGVIPYITREGPKGIKVKIGAKDYTIKSWAQWNDMFADIGGRQRAWYMLTKFKQMLNEVAPNEMAAIARVMDDASSLLSGVKSISGTEVRDIERTVGQAALVGPDEVMKLDVPLSRMQSQKALYEINKILDKCSEIFHVHKNYIRERTLSGQIFKDLPVEQQAIVNSIKEFNIVSLVSDTRQMQKLATSFLTFQPANMDDLLRHMGFITDLLEATDGRISDVRKLVESRAASLTPDERAAFHTGTWQQIMDFIDGSTSSIDYITDIMRRQINGEDFMMDWSKVKFSGGAEQHIDKIKELIDTLPMEMRGAVREVRFDPAALHKKGASGEFTWQGEILLMGPENLITPRGLSTTYHEFMHSWSAAKISSGDYQFMFDFLEAIGAKDTPQWKLTLQAKDNSWTDKEFYQRQAQMFAWDQRPEEMLASNFGFYCSHDKTLEAGAETFFLNHMPMHLSHPKLTKLQISRSLELIDNMRHRSIALAATRTRERMIAEDLISRRPKFKSPDESTAWWARFYAERDVPWQDFRSVDRQLFRQQEELKAALVPRKTAEPRLPPPIKTELTPLHIAYIFGVSGDDLTRGLIKASTMTIMSKEKFTDYVMVKVESLAQRYGQTAADLGFTEQSVGKCYEQMLRNIGVDPVLAAKEPMIPALYQVDNVFKELEKIKGTRGIPKEDYLKIKQYINDVAAGLRETPMYKARAPSITREQFDAKWITGAEPIASIPGEPIAAYGNEAALFDTPEGKYYIVRSDKSRLYNPKTSSELFDSAQEAKTAYFHEIEAKVVAPELETGKPFTTNAFRGEKPKGLPATDEGLVGKAKYFSTNEAYAKTYGTVTESTIELKNPLVIKTQKEFNDFSDNYIRPLRDEAQKNNFDENWVQQKLRDDLEKAGYDGVVIEAGIVEKGRQIAVFNPKVSVKPKQFKPTQQGNPAWWAKKEDAMVRARKQYELDFTDYSNYNAVDATMRHIFPFWTYEWQRWFWLPRQMLQHPGIATGLGKYQDYSDSGYIPIPGTDIQFNPFRGTVFMGGFRRLFLRDYPEYYDSFPGMKIIDAISRIGFYPGINAMLPIVAFGAARGKPEWGEIAPAWLKTGLDAAIAVLPNSAIKPLTEQLFPDRFRDYLTILTLTAAGYDGLDLWNKMKENRMSDTERNLWAGAVKKATGLKGILFEQGGIFRLRPQEYNKFIKDSQLLIEKLTGVPVKTQEVINRRYPVTGQRLSDIYPLNILQQKLLYELEGYDRWQGVSAPLQPSSWQEEDRRIREYYTAIEDVYEGARTVGIVDEAGNILMPSVKELNRMLIAGEINPSQWVSMRGDLMSRISTAINEISTKVYPDVPKTLEEREARLAERGVPAPVYSPDEELLYKYYELFPQWKYDWEAQRFTWDFDTYYGMVDAIIGTLQEPYRQIFIDRIQYNWTPMERLYWDTSRQYLRPYRMMRQLILDKFTPEQQLIIRQYEVATGPEREALLAIVDPATNNGLISEFSRQVRDARINLRKISPTMDAWLCFWGVTDVMYSQQAKDLYAQYREQYVVESMVE